ncbi:hypothetical protein AXF42_Ash007424 [Apostasia shenzhenica]|uniref:Uncharacterized protein n=1 Tax=Apostasia shenzhenica TaxID=1088818 RepID=A0A2I0BA54_9ASPA|nr:hypothetical protein AXF42_Ash007424 [Apostasia shenzhenica]
MPPEPSESPELSMPSMPPEPFETAMLRLILGLDEMVPFTAGRTLPADWKMLMSSSLYVTGLMLSSQVFYKHNTLPRGESFPSTAGLSSSGVGAC